MGSNGISLDKLSIQIRKEALEAEKAEPELSTLLRRTVLAPSVVTFEDAVASTVTYRLLGIEAACNEHAGASTSAPPCFSPNELLDIIKNAMTCEHEELGHTMAYACREDALAVCRRDPACETLLEVVLFFKGYSALVCHRAARRKWMCAKETSGKRSMTALFLQSQASAVFGVDIHPAATIGAGILFDHATGIVIGETAVVGDGCTILHGVTLGGTGKEAGDRHPKIGSSVLIGAGTKVLGNVRVGDRSKIGAGSIVLRNIPSGVTAVGSPAKIIGRVIEKRPGSAMDSSLEITISKMPVNLSYLSLDTMIPPPIVETESETDSDITSKNEEDCFSPFRDIVRNGIKNAPPGSITFCKLKNLLTPLNLTQEEFLNVYVALDPDMKGYISMDQLRSNGANMVSRFTKIDDPTRVEKCFQHNLVEAK